MQSVKRTRRETSRLVLTGILCFLLVGLIAGCETTDGTKEVLQPRPHEHSHPESATREDVRAEIQTMVGPVIESLVQETSSAIAGIKEKLDRLYAAGDDGDDGLDYIITYQFENFDPVGATGPAAREERQAREAFFAELRGWLDKAIARGLQIKYASPQSTPVNGYIPWVKLTNAQATSGGMTHQDQIEAVIEELAERTVQDPHLAVPVRKDPEPARLPVRHLTVVHNATSGVGDSECEQITR